MQKKVIKKTQHINNSRCKCKYYRTMCFVYQLYRHVSNIVE